MTIVLIGTGGTIAARAADPTRPHVYEDSQRDVAELLAGVPLPAGLHVRCEQPLQCGSEDFTEATWRALALQVAQHLARRDVDGVVLAQGTDTIEESACFLALVHASDKPLVVTGAMRPAGTLGSDVPINLFQALALAAHPSARGRGVLVRMNERIHAPAHVTKAHTYAADAFDSPGAGPLGCMLGGEPHWHAPARRATPFAGVPGLLAQPLPPVALLWGHAGLRREAITQAVDTGAAGLVLAGTGNGTVATRLQAAVLEAGLRGCLVVRASRCPSGVVARNAAEDDEVLCTVASGAVPALKACVLLQLALGAGWDRTRIQAAFDAWPGYAAGS